MNRIDIKVVEVITIKDITNNNTKGAIIVIILMTVDGTILEAEVGTEVLEVDIAQIVEILGIEIIVEIFIIVIGDKKFL